MSETVAIVPAAGSGERLGAGTAKAFVSLGGRTLLEMAVDGLHRLWGHRTGRRRRASWRVAEAVELLGERAAVVAGGSNASTASALRWPR